jgi:hypothetical protein
MITVHCKISQVNNFSLSFNALAQKIRYFLRICSVIHIVTKKNRVSIEG